MNVDVDAILAGLPAELDDPGINPWGGASLAEVWTDTPDDAEPYENAYPVKYVSVSTEGAA